MLHDVAFKAQQRKESTSFSVYSPEYPESGSIQTHLSASASCLYDVGLALAQILLPGPPLVQSYMLQDQTA